MNSITVLQSLSAKLGGRLKNKKVLLEDGSVLRKEMQATYQEHKIELLGNESLVLVDIEATYGQFKLFTINARELRYKYGKIAAVPKIQHSIRTFDGYLSNAQHELIASQDFSNMLDVISPQKGEEINVSQRLVRMYLCMPTVSRVMEIIDAVIDCMPHESSESAGDDYSNLPVSLQPLIPLLMKWAIDDDDKRSRKLQRSARSTRLKLVEAVIPKLSAINEYLDSFGEDPPLETCAFGSLSQAALEAQKLLESE